MSTRIACLSVGLAAASWMACGEDPVAPRPEWMEPSAGSSAAPVPVVIHGEGFLLRPQQEQSSGESDLVVTHRAWLGEVELVPVTWVDPRTLQATVPPGLAPGSKRLVVENAYGRRGALDGAFEVVELPALEAALGVAPAAFNVGQPARVTLSVRNAGEATVRDVTPEAIAPSGTAAAGAALDGPAPPSVDRLDPGAAATFTWALTAARPGGLSLAARARGTDAASSAALSSPVAEASALVQTPAALEAALGVEGLVRERNPFTVALTVRNTGEAGVLVTRVQRAVSPKNAAVCDAPAPPPPQPVDGLGSGAFSWSCTPLEDDTVAVKVTVVGTDANSGEVVQATDELRVEVD